MEKLKITMPIIVEGKYDKIKLSSIVDAPIITSEGFRIFKSPEKRALIRRLAENSKVIILSDSDHAGQMIRSHINGIIPKEKIINLYTPQIKGKERRKDKASKEGFVGVEGVEADILRELLKPFSAGEVQSERKIITKTDFYELGLSGTGEAKARRAKVLTALSLPGDLSANAMLEAVNLLIGYEEFVDIVKNID